MKNRTPMTSVEVERLLEPARERLREFGITIVVESSGVDPDSRADALIELSRGGVTSTYAVWIAPSMTLTSLAQGMLVGERPLLVVGDRISRRSAEAFREANVQFLDALGNAYISFDGVLIDVQGRATSADEQSPRRSDPAVSRPSNLFSRVRAQVILALLAWPELAGLRQRDIAAAAGTSLGQAHDVFTRLGEAGYLAGTALSPARFGELLDLWTAAYPTGLGPHLQVARFSGDPGRPFTGEQAAYLSGESAAGVDIVRPATLTVYVDSWDPKLAVANRWAVNPDRVDNIFVRRKFWTSPRPAEEPAAKPGNAPWPLVYADLMATGDARLVEVARTWRGDRAGSGPS
ncbi:type IV toxin-antitoxin system AbiEi family antitoxin [Actinoplanes sp. NPDC026670]|uniref:type IV toxin-antitoxin system AbiEi family antitoxin n=1 Tax=Actinoplanes sp. NPDC026670 TaxID=3154700 RepID=UPI0033F7EDEC